MKPASDPQRAYRVRVAALYAKLESLVPDYGPETEEDLKQPKKRCRLTILRHAIRLLKCIRLDSEVRQCLVCNGSQCTWPLLTLM